MEDDFLRLMLSLATAEHNAAVATERGVRLLFVDYVRFGRPADMYEAVDQFRIALAHMPVFHPDRSECLSNLAAGLLKVYEHTGEISTLSEAIDVARDAVAVGLLHPEHAGHLTNLGIVLHTLAERTGDAAALREAVETHRKAVAAAAADHSERGSYLANLCGVLLMQYDQTGDPAALAEAVDAGRQAVAAADPDDPMPGPDLNNLSLALGKLFELTGDTAVLAEAVEMGRRAVDATSPRAPARAGYLSNLCAELRRMFLQTGDAAVLAEAVETGRRAVRATAPDDPNRCAHLTNLGAALRTSFERKPDGAVLREAVETCRRAVEATPGGDWRRRGHLANFGNVLITLYGAVGEVAILDEATRVAEQCVAAAPEGDPYRTRFLTNLCTNLQMLYEARGDPAVLGRAVDAGRRAVADAALDDPDRGSYLVNVAQALVTAADVSGPGRATPERRAAARDEAVDHLRTAAELTTATPHTRVAALRMLALLLGEGRGRGGEGSGGAEPGGAEEALAAMEAAVALLPQISPRTLMRGDREHRIGQLGSIADLAATAALTARRPERAVELLEAARGVLTADVITARSSDLARLREAAPDLAREFEALRDRREQLDASAVQDPAHAGRDLAQARAAAQQQWDELVERIRALDGWSGFLATPGIAELCAQAEEGPIVFLVASRTRSDALIVTGNGVRTVRLNKLTYTDAALHAHRLRAAHKATASASERKAAQREILATLAWLWDVAAGPILTALDHTTDHTPTTPPRIWWSPVGILAHLPLHAAGHHDDLADPSPRTDDLANSLPLADNLADSPPHAESLADSLPVDGSLTDSPPRAADPASPPPRTVLDRRTSSYTPTIRALAYSRSHPPAATAATLIVAVPDAPGADPLPGAEAEAEAIAALIPAALRPARPIRADVRRALPTHPVVHFSCHGVADPVDPAAGSLILYDHRVAPLTVADINALPSPGALAFLSACDTAVAGTRFADEALHLTGAFHLAGYRNVVGTLRPVADDAAARVATDFYRHLTAGGTAPPDASLSAYALHRALRAERDRYPKSPSNWTAHTHTGV